MIKTRYYLKFGKQTSTFGIDPQKWIKEFGWEFVKSNGVKVYYDEDAKQLYCYERPTLLRQYDWGHTMYSLHSADLIIDYEKVVEVEEKTIKLESGKSKKIQWKSSNRGGNGKNVTLNPKPSNVTKNPGPVRFYESIEENGFTRLNNPKKSSPKGTIVGIITGV